MGTGQMMITIGAIILLGSVILTTNTGISDSSQIVNEANYGIEEVGLATMIMQEALSQAYDQACSDSQAIANVTSFTSVKSLGQESGSSDFDDFDDWNGKSQNSGGGMGGSGWTSPVYPLATGNYLAKTRVGYVKWDSKNKTFDIDTSGQEWCKRLDVWVWNTVDSAGSVLTMHTFKTYW
ncbi:MAG: hypothetical protein ACLP05_12230 [Candidatus Kryptoniota bacterium]